MPWKFNDALPIYAQILEELKKRIVVGEYQPGSKVPAVRELAVEASVNPNTMQKALVELENLGLVESQRTSGRFVTNDIEKIKNIREQLAKERTSTFIGTMIKLGFTKEEIINEISSYKE